MEKTENNNLDQNTEEKIDFSGNTEKDNDIGGRSENRESDINKTGETTKSDCDAGSKQSFEELIKGPYKEEFDKRVQRIINKRFKELKTRENTKENIKQTDRKNENNPETGKDHEQTKQPAADYAAYDFDVEAEFENPVFKALTESGVDIQTAYNVIHFDEIMNNSVKKGEAIGAKRVADSIRFKSGRPFENGLDGKGGYALRAGAGNLTPKKRRELAKRSLMGEKVGF